MNPKTQTIILAVLSIVAIVLATFATTMALLPQNNNSTPTFPSEHSLDTQNISRAPIDLPGPIVPGRTTPKNITVTLVTKELYGEK